MCPRVSMELKSKNSFTSKSVTPNSSKPKQAPTTAASTKSKRKKKFKRLKIVEKQSSDLKRIVTNIKRPKSEVSSNWQAFLATGLHQSISSTKELHSSTSKPKSLPRIKVERLSSTATTQNPVVKDLPTVEFNSDDTYVTDLDPKTEEQRHELTRCIAMDCEMVGVFDGKESILARVSLVNQHGECVYDRYVKPKEKVADYRTKVSGIRPTDLKRGEEFEVVQKEVAAILDGKILVGHALQNDLRVLMIKHPPNMIRDTSRFKPFRNITSGRTPSLKKLSQEILGVSIQSGEHSSIEDAKATMQLYNLYQKEWEDHRLKKKFIRRKNAIAAALGQSNSLSKKKEGLKSRKNSLNDEFSAF